MAEVGLRTQVAIAHAVQLVGTREQICPLGHVGHVGVSSGHCIHRRNMVRRLSSTAEVMLVPGWYIVVSSDVPLDTPLRSVEAIIAANFVSTALLSRIPNENRRFVWHCSADNCRRSLVVAM
jgi:hypothetical protein